jgi:hypothetical protein
MQTTTGVSLPTSPAPPPSVNAAARLWGYIYDGM